MTERRRVLLVTTSTGTAGAERVVASLARRLPRAAWEVEVVYLTGEPTPLDDAVAAVGIPVTRLDGARNRPLALSRELGEVIEAGQPALVHAHLHHANVLAARVLRRHPEVPLIITAHVIDPRFRPLRPWLDRRAARRAARVVGVSDAVSADLRVRLGASVRDRIVTVRNGVELGDLSRVAPLSGDEAPIIAGIGRLDRQKGFDLLLEAFATVLRAHPDALLHLAGQGPEEEALRAQAKRLGVEERVRWLGLCTDVGAVLAGAVALAFPSRWEGFGLVLAEAAAAARPVVAAALPPTREIVEDNETGLLVPANDAEAMARGLLRLLDDRRFAGRLGRAARERAHRELGVARMVADYEDLYNRVLA